MSSTIQNDSFDDVSIHQEEEDTSSDQTFQTAALSNEEASTKLTKAAHPDHRFYTDHVMMCEPTAFYLNEETIEDNKFMQRVSHTKEQSSKIALE